MSTESNVRLPRRLKDYTHVVLDCDGVILDSNALKSEAMGRALDGEPRERIDAFLAYHHEEGGVSRYVKFAHYFETMYPAPDAEARAGAAVARYAALVQAGMRACAEIPGARALLERLHAANVLCFVNSGGDQDELAAALAERGLARYFAGIFGSPATKTDNLARIEASAAGGPGVYLGDARSDLSAAEAFGLDFVFVAQFSEWRDGEAHCAAAGIPVIATPAEIGRIEPGRGP